MDPAFPTSATTLSTMTQWEALFGEMAPSGVVPGVGSQLAPSINSGARTVTAGSGGLLIRGFRGGGAAATTLNIPAADTQNRIDRLVVRLDRTAGTAADWVKAVIITGAPSSAPAAPAILRTTAGSWDLPICRYTANSNGSITGLVDERAILTPSLAFRSTARPTLSGPGWGLETDTGRPVYTTNGSDWAALVDDTGDVALSRNGSDGAFWSSGGGSIRRIGNMVDLRISINRGSSNLSDPSTPIVIPADFRPPVTRVGLGFHSRSPVGITVTTDGKVTITPLTTDITAGKTVTASAHWTR